MLTESKILRLLAPLFEGVPLVVGHQNAPAPSGEYAVLWLLTRMTYSLGEYDRENQTIIEYDDSTYRIQFVGKQSADKLRRVRGLASFPDFRDRCHRADAVVMSWEPVQYTPMQEENGRWSDRSSLDLKIRQRVVTDRREPDADGWIETADVTGRVNSGKP